MKICRDSLQTCFVWLIRFQPVITLNKMVLTVKLYKKFCSFNKFTNYHKSSQGLPIVTMTYLCTKCSFENKPCLVC